MIGEWATVDPVGTSRAACVVETGYCCIVGRMEDHLVVGAGSTVALEVAASEEGRTLAAAVVTRRAGL